jgi:hypothetical protein
MSVQRGRKVSKDIETLLGIISEHFQDVFVTNNTVTVPTGRHEVFENIRLKLNEKNVVKTVDAIRLSCQRHSLLIQQTLLTVLSRSPSVTRQI